MQSQGMALSWLRRALAGGERQPEAGSSKRSRRAGADAGHRCRKCAKPFRADAQRCPFCGTRTLVAEELLPSADPAPRTELTEIERRILIAAREPRQRIVALPSVGIRQGEVKAGSERIYGDGALSALDGLIAEGLVAARDGAEWLELTEPGRSLAATL